MEALLRSSRYLGIILICGVVMWSWAAPPAGLGWEQPEELPLITLTTLFGRVFVSPTCPVEREGAPGCEPQPLEAEIVLQSLDGRDIAVLRSNEEGFFGVGLVGLPPGGYRLHPLPPRPGLPPYPPEDLEVEIVEGELTFVEITYDSGIR